MPPPSPKGARVTDIDANKVQLAWESPSAAENSPVGGFIIEAREKNSGKWVKLKQLPANASNCTVDGLENEKEYEFRVMATNEFGNSEPSEATAMTTVRAKAVPARISDKNALLGTRMKSGQQFRLVAKFTGVPEPEVEWKVDGKPVQTDETLVITTEPGKLETVIELKNSKRKQTGVYQVSVKNKSGSDKHDFEIVVLSSPSKPKGPIKVEDVLKNSCKLKWGKPEDMGGTDFLGYKVEKFDEDKGIWETVKEGIKDNELDVKGLKEGHDYKFRVKAVNSQGESEPLVTDNATHAKNPFGIFLF